MLEQRWGCENEKASCLTYAWADSQRIRTLRGRSAGVEEEGAKRKEKNAHERNERDVSDACEEEQVQPKAKRPNEVDLLLEGGDMMPDEAGEGDESNQLGALSVPEELRMGLQVVMVAVGPW